MIITTTETQTKVRSNSRIILRPLKLRESHISGENSNNNSQAIFPYINRKKSEDKNIFTLSNGFHRFKQIELGQKINNFKNTIAQNHPKIIRDIKIENRIETLFGNKEKKQIKPIQTNYNIKEIKFEKSENNSKIFEKEKIEKKIKEKEKIN